MPADKRIDYLKSLFDDLQKETLELIRYHTNGLNQIGTVIDGISQVKDIPINYNHFFELAEIINARISHVRKLNIERLKQTCVDGDDEMTGLCNFSKLYDNGNTNIKDLSENNHNLKDANDVNNSEGNCSYEKVVVESKSYENEAYYNLGLSVIEEEDEVSIQDENGETTITEVTAKESSEKKLEANSDLIKQSLPPGIPPSLPSSLPPTPNFSVGSELPAQLISIVSPAEFYVFFFGNDQNRYTYTSLMTQMQDDAAFLVNLGRYDSKQQAKKAMGSDYCMVYEPEINFWFRAKILDWCLEQECKTLKVYYCDCGETAYASLENIRYMQSVFSKFHAVASKCHLYNITVDGHNWSVDAINYFQNLDVVTCTIMEEAGDSYGVVLHVDGININDDFVKKGWAVKSDSISQLAGNESSIKLKEVTESLTLDEVNSIEKLQMDVEELDITSNACMAVMGYEPKDESRICKFQDPISGSCFKGANCTKEHGTIDPDGWTRDLVEVHNCILPSPISPMIGSTVRIAVTYVSFPTIFHGTYETVMPGQFGSMALFADYMNSPEVIKSYKKLEAEPALGELVIAPYRVDGCFYRAQVISVPHNGYVNVTFVDYGNPARVPLKELRQFSAEFADLPCQAITCSIANVSILPSTKDIVRYHKEIVHKMDELLLYQVVKCKVIDVLDGQLSVIAELHGEDVAAHLQQLGYAKRIPISEPKEVTIVKFLPG